MEIPYENKDEQDRQDDDQDDAADDYIVNDPKVKRIIDDLDEDGLFLFGAIKELIRRVIELEKREQIRANTIAITYPSQLKVEVGGTISMKKIEETLDRTLRKISVSNNDDPKPDRREVY